MKKNMRMKIARMECDMSQEELAKKVVLQGRQV